MGFLTYRSSSKHYPITDSMSWLGGMTNNSLAKTSKNLLNIGTSGSLTGVQLIQLHTVGNSFSWDYRFCDILQFIPIRGGKLYGLLGTFMGALFLLNQSIPRMTSVPFESKTIRLPTKSTPYFKVQLKTYFLPDTSLLRSITSIQKQHQPFECLWGFMANLSSNLILLDSARVGFPG
jgi:hypothetical protein